MNTILGALFFAVVGWIAFFAFAWWSRRERRTQRLRDAHYQEHMVEPFMVALAMEYRVCICEHRLPCPQHPDPMPELEVPDGDRDAG
jgi:hypothetical protein